MTLVVLDPRRKTLPPAQSLASPSMLYAHVADSSSSMAWPSLSTKPDVGDRDRPTRISYEEQLPAQQANQLTHR